MIETKKIEYGSRTYKLIACAFVVSIVLCCWGVINLITILSNPEPETHTPRIYTIERGGTLTIYGRSIYSPTIKYNGLLDGRLVISEYAGSGFFGLGGQSWISHYISRSVNAFTIDKVDFRLIRASSTEITLEVVENHWK